MKYFLEIKNRIILLLITILSTLFMSYLYKETLLFLITQPERLMFNNNSSSVFYFIFTNVTEILSVYVQLITFLGFQAFLFFTFYHCFVFFSPAMFKSEYCFLFTFFKVSTTVWLFSAMVANFLLIPITWDFFFSFQKLFSDTFVNLHFEAKLTEYLDFYILIYYLSLMYFQIFTVFFFFFNYMSNKIKIIQQCRKIYYYFFIIFSTFISPPDLISQFFVSFVIIFFYEILVFIVVIKEINVN
jgi:sec-independent protein translocase protein TatC